MKFLIAGLGSIGRRHLRNLIALGENDIILYRTNRSTLPDDELKPYPVFHDLTSALSQKPDAVIVSNPTSLHMDVAIPAALSGSCLLLEKPVADSMERISELERALVVGGGKVLVGFQFRYHPGLRKIKKLLEENASGKPVYVRAHWGEYLPGWHPWEDYRSSYAARADLGGGVVRTLCHPLDYLRWLFGEVNFVSATMKNSGILEVDVEDVADIHLSFSNGAMGSVHLNYLQRPPRHDLELITTRGAIHWDNSSGEVSVFMEGATEAWEKYPVPAGFERNHLFLSQMSHFLKLIRGEEDSLCSLQDGIMSQRIVEAVYASSLKQIPIQVDCRSNE